MTDKFNKLCTLSGLIFWLAAANANAVETLKPEDEDIFIETITEQQAPAPSHKMVLPISNKYTYSPNAPRKIEGFAPNELPPSSTSLTSDPKVVEFRKMIDDCLALRRDRLNLEREMLAVRSSAQNAAYISQTLENINLCYEDLGYEIIETFYNHDITTIKNFTKKAKTFYITGTDASLNPHYCGETCSLLAVVDTQIAKFFEFQAYLNQLLDERLIKE